MPSIKPDAIVYSNLTEAYLNYKTLPSSISIAAFALSDGGSYPRQTTIPYARGGTRADIYLEQNGVRVPANIGSRVSPDVYQYAGSEIARITLQYDATTIYVTITIENNSGATINLIAQTITVSAVLYDAPITSL